MNRIVFGEFEKSSQFHVREDGSQTYVCLSSRVRSPIMAEVRQAARRAAASQRWDDFPEHVKVKFGELCSAVASGSLEKVQEWWAQNEESLGAIGITPDTPLNDYGFTAVHFASFFGQEDIVRYLVGAHGADVNVRDAVFGGTPLMRGALNNKPACVRALLELGADPELRDDDQGKKALEWARDSGNQECVDILEQWVPAPSVKSALKG